MLGQELSKVQFHRLQAGEFDDFFAFLSEAGFAASVQVLQSELQQLVLKEHGQLELAADFAQCFLLEGGISALPYASAYLSEAELAQNFAQMDRWLDRFDLQINRQVNEPSDHLCVYLEILLKLVEQESLATQQQFIAQQLLSWLPQMAQKVAQIPLASNLYPTLLQLLIEMLNTHLIIEENV